MQLNPELRALIIELGGLGRARGVAGDVRTKVNARGELVIGLIIRPRYAGEWSDSPTQSREEKRAARERRG